MTRDEIVAALREKTRVLYEGKPLRDAMVAYRAEVARRVNTGGARTQICNDLVGRFPVFASEERALFCTDLSATVAEIVAEIALAHGARLAPTPIRR